MAFSQRTGVSASAPTSIDRIRYFLTPAILGQGKVGTFKSNCEVLHRLGFGFYDLIHLVDAIDKTGRFGGAIHGQVQQIYRKRSEVAISFVEGLGICVNSSVPRICGCGYRERRSRLVPITVPKVNVPTVSVPRVYVPTRPKFNVPTVSVPKFNVPTVSVPKFNVPTVSVPRVNLSTANVPTATNPPSGFDRTLKGGPWVRNIHGHEVRTTREEPLPPSAAQS